MTQSDVLSFLSSVSVGTIVAWVVVISAIVTTVLSLLKKLYGSFKKAYLKQEAEESLREKVKSHDSKLAAISDQLVVIAASLDRQEQSELKRLRHSIVRACEEALNKGSMTVREYASVAELYADYHDGRFHENSYVSSLMRKVDKNVKIIGKLDEHGEDIDE